MTFLKACPSNIARSDRPAAAKAALIRSWVVLSFTWWL